jgi:hypothetical protein
LLIVDEVHAETVCAQVKIEIRQELAFEQCAFNVMMRISNGMDTHSIESADELSRALTSMIETATTHFQGLKQSYGCSG